MCLGFFLVQNSFQATIFYRVIGQIFKHNIGFVFEVPSFHHCLMAQWNQNYSELFKMRGCTMRVPLQLTSYPLPPLISGGGTTLRYAKKYFIPLQGRYAKTYFTIFKNKKVKERCGTFWAPCKHPMRSQVLGDSLTLENRFVD